MKFNKQIEASALVSEFPLFAHLHTHTAHKSGADLKFREGYLDHILDRGGGDDGGEIYLQMAG